ncbi:lipase precursor [Cordyceps fumosorosea ARSEF 2679]|uniref:Lipase n=1 Tax=Cordyceps fumosorosea (strain ARSEF 2679) TaxID=1081104 RepID=A0A167P8H6_CORFA|nr:lipase precursor [Cordyceps fumosorosea ARSEF 2679]OAA56394.1 lipase precursor [Cordyceps fumosorosea ARSEF 2679]
MRVALLSLATAVAASPMADYLSSMEPRAAAMNDGMMNNFRFYAQHAAAAYCNAVGPSPGDSVACGGECDDVMRNGATIIDTFSGRKTGIAGYVSVDDTRREVVFSTRGSNNIRNFITDVLFLKRDCDFAPGCKMHIGFSDSWNEISAAATSAIKEGLAANPGYKLVVTGHSLGGAVAALGGAYLRRAGIPADVYTFGAPRVGNDAFANFANAQAGGLLLRMTHTDDPVPRLPPMIFGYRHGGAEYWLSNGGAMQNRYQTADVKVCTGIASVACNAGTFGFDILAHLHYLTDTADCAPVGIRWKRDDDEPSDDELKKRLTNWSEQDQALVNGSK